LVEWTQREVEKRVETTRPSLLMRIRDRSDAGAWRTFDAIYRPLLIRFAGTRGLDESDAEDVAQHCLTAIYDHIGDFSYDPQKGKFKSWLKTLVQHRISDLRRHQRAQQADTHALQSLEDPEPSPADVFERIWMEEHLAHCLRVLRTEVEERTFQAFQYHVLEEWPVDKVCAELNLKPNNVHTIKWRLTEQVTAKMRELLGDSE